MKVSDAIGDIIKVAFLVGIIYGAMKWQDIDLPGDDVKEFAESACVTEIRHRFDVTTVNAYAVNENSNGYVVRASVTLANGNIAKVNCLTNTHGGVKDITIEER